MQPFHLAFPVTDLQKAHDFYHGLVGCPVGRTSDRWIDLDFWGSQITAHLVDASDNDAAANPVDGKNVPVRHFGAILEMEEWESLAEKLRQQGIDFMIEPYIRFKGEVGEQATMFFLDPSGAHSYRDISVESLPSGIYFLQIRSGRKKTASEKLVILK